MAGSIKDFNRRIASTKKRLASGGGSSSSGSSSSNSSSSRKARQDQQDKAIADWKSGKITQKQASDIIKNIQRGGGSGSASNPAKYAAYQKSLAKYQKSLAKAQKAAVAAAAKKLAESRAIKESQRLATIKKNLLLAGARESKVVIRDKNNEIRLVKDTLIKNGIKIITTTNYKTGQEYIKQYKQGRIVGGLTSSISSKTDNKNIANELKDSNLKPITNKYGQVIGFSSSITQKSYKYTEAGFKAFNKDSKAGGAVLRKMIQDKKNNGMNIMEKDTDPKNIALNYNFRTPAKAFNTTKQIVKLMIRSTRTIPKVFKDYGISLSKGVVKLGLYAIDEAGYASQIKMNKQTGKLYIPSGTKSISNKLGKTKKWANYNFKTNPMRDPDYQAVAVTTVFSLIAIISPATAVKLFGVVKGKAVYDVIKNPTEYNMAVVESLFLPGAIKKIKKAVRRGDIMVAKGASAVPLMERIKQVDYLIKKSGKTIDAVTAKPTKNIIIRAIKGKTNPDYTYGNKVEFATPKVGKAYVTSEYFLKGKGTKLQRALKVGTVKIEKVRVSNLNAKYGSFIRKMLLSKGKMSESFIKKYYSEAKLEANRLRKPVAVISPKRLRGFHEAELEMIKMLPTKYKAPKLKFSGFTKEGYRVYSDSPYIKSIKKYVVSKVKGKEIQLSYFEKIAKEKLEYLKGRKVIKGEYAEHGIKHLTAENTDPFARRYARKMTVKKYGNTFKQHDLAKVSDADSFVEFEHGQVLYELWKRGKYPDKNIYKLPKSLQKQIAQAYAGHTPVKPRLIDTLKKGWKENSITKDLIWYAKNKRNPILQDILTLDRIELPRAGRWDFKIRYNLLDKGAVKRIYGSELNAVKNIRFLDWKTVPRRLRIKFNVKALKQIKLRDGVVLKKLKKLNIKRPVKKYSYKKITIKPSRVKTIPYKTSYYKSLKSTKYRTAYRNGYSDGYKSNSKMNLQYKSKYKSASKAYSIGYKSGKGSYKPGKYKPSKYKPGKYKPGKYKPSKYKPGKYKPGKYKPSKYKPGKTKKRPVIVPRILPKGFKRKTLSKKQPTFYIKIKRRGKIVNLTPRPLVLRDAKDFLAYSVDNGLEKSAWFEPLGKTKKAVKLPSKMKGYFGRNSRKLRPFKIRVGKKRAIRNGYIEKRKYGLDTKREKSQMRSTRKQTKRRMIKRKPLIKRSKINRPKQQRRKPVKRTPKRRTPPKRTRKKSKVVRRKPVKRKPVRKKLKVVRRKPVKRKPVRKKSTKRKKRK